MEALAEKRITEDTETCCTIFDPVPWNNTEHHWSNKLFLKDSVPELFHIPLPGTYRKVITRMWKMAQAAGAVPAPKDNLLLTHDPTPFKGELFMAITKEVPGAENIRLSGNFISKVFDGPYSKVPKYIDDMDGYLASMGKKSKKYYFYFAYCPKCAKKYQHNYVVTLAQV